MDNRRTYKVNIQGVEHDLLLTEQGVKRYGDRAQLVEAVEADVVVDEDTETETETVETKRSTPRNKGRQPRNK